MRSNPVGATVFSAALVLGCVVVDHGRPTSINQTKRKKQNLLDSVPKPNEAEFSRIGPQEWLNPYIVVNSDGFELVLGHGSESIKKAHVAEIEEVLLNLSLRRWPLGRVVTVTENGLRNPGEDFTKQREEVQRMLQSHKVKVVLWPSG